MKSSFSKHGFLSRWRVSALLAGGFFSFVVSTSSSYAVDKKIDHRDFNIIVKNPLCVFQDDLADKLAMAFTECGILKMQIDGFSLVLANWKSIDLDNDDTITKKDIEKRLHYLHENPVMDKENQLYVLGMLFCHSEFFKLVDNLEFPNLPVDGKIGKEDIVKLIKFLKISHEKCVEKEKGKFEELRDDEQAAYSSD